MFTGYDNPADKKVVAELGGKVTEDTHECAGWNPNRIYTMEVRTTNFAFPLQFSLLTKCAGRQNSCVWWRKVFPLSDRAGSLKARRRKPSKVRSIQRFSFFHSLFLKFSSFFRSLATHYRGRRVREEVGFQSPQDSPRGSKDASARQLQSSRDQVGGSSP